MPDVLLCEPFATEFEGVRRLVAIHSHFVQIKRLSRLPLDCTTLGYDHNKARLDTKIQLTLIRFQKYYTKRALDFESHIFSTQPGKHTYHYHDRRGYLPRYHLSQLLRGLHPTLWEGYHDLCREFLTVTGLPTTIGGASNKTDTIEFEKNPDGSVVVFAGYCIRPVIPLPRLDSHPYDFTPTRIRPPLPFSPDSPLPPSPTPAPAPSSPVCFPVPLSPPSLEFPELFMGG